MDKCKIRRWLKDDFSTLAKYLNNKKIWDNCRDSLPYPYSESDAQQFIRFVLNQSEQNNYCIEVNQEAVGNISFSRGIDVERYNAELGYWLAEPYWGKGILPTFCTIRANGQENRSWRWIAVHSPKNLLRRHSSDTSKERSRVRTAARKVISTKRKVAHCFWTRWVISLWKPSRCFCEPYRSGDTAR